MTVGEPIIRMGGNGTVWVGIVVWVCGEDYRVDRWRLIP